ncbi:uncharacterized protein LOC123310250 [Coccinella septempunctata]|uniref:uncharacterized protein LOC123310250 n=1 Tax=Coccinella septempunctata TaxID=41139 RepID=UPI001D087C88|nr:uncharacterized protein LOC123310250 [Coccinella septempunctata]
MPNIIGMIFGLEKCAVVNVRRGRLAEGENVELSDGRTVPILGQEERYKYLGIQQTFEIRQQENKMETERELIRRVRRIMNTQLSAKNKMEAINIWAVPVFAYTAGILIWSKSDLEKLDRKIRSILTQYGTLHPNSAIERLYLPRKEGGRGLSNLQDIYLKEEKKIKNYFQTGITPIQKWVASQRYPSSGETSTHEPEIEDFKEILKQNWQTKPLHGRFFASLNQSDVDKLSSSTYLTQGYLFPQTEGTFLAIQDQVVPTRVYTKHIMKQQVQTTKCRLCDKAEETVQHLSSGCSTIAGTKYLGRHDNMGKVVHQSLCLREQLLPHFIPHHIYAPQTILENETTKVYWDLSIITDRGVEHNRPDMVVWSKKDKKAYIIDFAVPLDQNLSKAYGEKIAKYEPLAKEIKNMWRLEKVEIKPLIISCNGLVHRKTTEHVKEIQLPANTILWMQKAVILGTVGIIRQAIYPH